MDDPMKNKQLVEAFIDEVFVRHDLSRLEQFLREDYIQHNPDVAQGRSGFKHFFARTFAAIPDFKYTLKAIVAEHDRVWVYCATTGTHSAAEWLGMPPSGRSLSFDVVDMFRVEAGKIAEHWDVADTLSLFSQLGKAKSIA